jgi:hypothetical protein
MSDYNEHLISMAGGDSSDFQAYKTTASVVGGEVYLSLPGDAYIQMSPDKARKMAVILFTKANEAEGLAAPEVIVLRDSKKATK